VGYPARGAYRDYHHHTVHHHNPWSNDGAPYAHDGALALAREHAADFVSRTLARLSDVQARETLPGGGLVVCALDTELFGHWWYEGVAFLEAVVGECARQGLELVRLDDALERFEPALLEDSTEPAEQPSSWGTDGDLSTWSGPPVAEMAFEVRAAELEIMAAGARAGTAAARELLALQASDWPFMVSRGQAVPYARQRFAGHRDALTGALREGPDGDLRHLRNLAVDAERSALLAP
jgi:1,4-alpha-glucan branching enzyme